VFKTQNTCDKCRLLGMTMTSGETEAVTDETAVVHVVHTETVAAFVATFAECPNKTNITNYTINCLFTFIS